MVQLNTRIDADVKECGDAVFARNGYSPSQAVRSLWQYAAEHQAVPPFMAEASDKAKATMDKRGDLVAQGYGMAFRLAKERGLSLAPLEGDIDVVALQDAVYADALDEYERDHV